LKKTFVSAGPKDIAAGRVSCARRDTLEKGIAVPIDGLVAGVQDLLKMIQADMLAKASVKSAAGIVKVTEWKDMTPTLNAMKLMQVPFCGEKGCEGDIKERTRVESMTEGEEERDENAPSMGAKSLCFPIAPLYKLTAGMKCINPDCGKDAINVCMFGRSY
jgi:prolyl-tRNA synthetase